MADSTTPASAFPGLPRDPYVPVSIIDKKLLSTTSVAGECFVYQRFSGRLQHYLIDYVSKVYGDFAVYE